MRIEALLYNFNYVLRVVVGKALTGSSELLDGAINNKISRAGTNSELDHRHSAQLSSLK